MEGIHLLRNLLQPQDWLGKIDLKDAYFVIPVWKDHRKYLRFVWKGSLLEFACLLFGLAAAPRLFTKVLKPVVALLRRARIRLIIYLDDLLFMNQSKEGLGLDMATARYLLENLGFVINLEKSCFVPTQNMEFLGFVVNTQAMTLLLPNSKVESLNSHCNYLLVLPEVSVRDLSQLIGKLTASIQAILIFPAPLHYRHIQHLKHQLSFSTTKGLRCNNTSVDRGQGGITLVVSPSECLERSWASSPPSRYSDRNGRIEDGLGGRMPGGANRGVMERKLHINCLEFLAGSFAVNSFTKNRLCVHVRLRMDNTSAVTYVNCLEGTHSLVLSNLALALWEWHSGRQWRRQVSEFGGHLRGNMHLGGGAR